MSNEASWLVESLKENEGLVEVMELVKMGRKEGDYLWWETSKYLTSTYSFVGRLTGSFLVMLNKRPDFGMVHKCHIVGMCIIIFRVVPSTLRVYPPFE